MGSGKETSGAQWAKRRGAIWAGALVMLAVLIAWRDVLWSVMVKAVGGALLAWALCPLCMRLEQRMGRTLAAIVSVCMCALALAAFAALLLPPLVREFAAFSRGLPQAAQEGYAFIQAKMRALHIDVQALSTHLSEAAAKLSVGFFPLLMRGAGSVASFFGTLFFSLVLSIYFLREREMFTLYLSMLVPLRVRKRCLYACAQVRRELVGYVRGQLTISALVAALTAAGLFVLRVPYALVLGLLMGLLNIIPYFGPFIGAIPIAMFSAQSGITGMIWALALVILIQQLEANWLSPRVMENATGLHPVTVMLGVFSFGTFAGVAGMFVAVPCMLCVRAVFRVIRTEP